MNRFRRQQGWCPIRPPGSGITRWRRTAWVIMVVGCSMTGPHHVDAKTTKLPQAERLLLTTGDGLALSCVYYPGVGERDTAPVILVHGWDSSAEVWSGLATLLQAQGFAVMAPDLRGHGQSMSRKVPGRKPIEMKRDRFRSRDVLAMARYDLEAVKKHLVGLHNQEQLNIELLTIVGVDAGAVAAVNWVALDWAWPELPAFKQGQDVKAMVLISLPSGVKGVNVRPPLLKSHRAIRTQLGALFIYGDRDGKSSKNSAQLYKILSRTRASAGDVQQVVFKTSRGGSEMMEAAGNELHAEIADYLSAQVEKYRRRYAWVTRSGYLAD